MDARLILSEAESLFPKMRITWDALSPTWEGAARRAFEADYIALFDREAKRFVQTAERLSSIGTQVDELLR